MIRLRFALLAILAFSLTGCLELKQKMVIKADQSGELQCSYTLTPAALKALRELATPVRGSTAKPILQPFPVTKREIMDLTLQEGIDAKDVTISNTPDGGRKVEYTITFTSLRKFARSSASDLFRFQLAKAKAGGLQMQAKSLGLDYLDWRLPRQASATRAEKILADMKAKAKGLKCSVSIELPGKVLESNATKTEGNAVSWTYALDDLSMKQIIGDDKVLRMPTVRFENADIKPMVTDAKAHIPSIKPDLLTGEMYTFRLQKSEETVGEGENAVKVPFTRATLGLRMNYPENMLPISYTSPQITELATPAGKSLVVPLPPQFGVARRIPAPDRRNPERRFYVYSLFSTSEEVTGFSRLAAQFVLTYAERREQRELPLVGQWTNASHESKTPGGRQVKISIPEEGSLHVDYEPGTELEVQDIRFLNANGEMLTVTGVTREAITPKNPDDPKTRSARFKVKMAKDSRVAITWNVNVRRERLTFSLADLKQGGERVPVTIEDMSGKSLRLIASMKAHERDVRSVAISPDGSMAASGALDGSVLIWDLQTKKKTVIKAHESGVNDLAFGPKGKILVSAGQDKTVAVWNVADGKSIAKLQGSTSQVRGVTMTPDGKKVISVGLDKKVRVWDLGTKTNTATFDGHSRGVRAVAISGTGKLLLTGGLDRKMILWDLAANKKIRELEGHKFSVRTLAVSPDGKTAISGADDMTVRLWNLETGDLIREYKGHSNLVTGVVFLPDGKRFAAADMDGEIRIWDATGEAKLASLRSKDDPILSLAIDTEGYLAAGTRDGKLLIIKLPVAEEE